MKFYGVNDPEVSNVYKVWIQQDHVMVCGVIGEGSSMELISQWETPFEGMTLGAKSGGALSGVAQETFKGTTRSKFTSLQQWSGNQPISINLSLEFYALNDAEKEVTMACKTLQQFASPELESILMPGRRPKPVSLNIGGKMVITNAYITNVSIPLDGGKTSEGDQLTTTVNLQLSSKGERSSSDFDTIYK